MSSVGYQPRVLIVEDEAVTAADLQASLERLGYQIAGVATTGAKAVRAAGESSPDVVLMDIRLRGSMDGIAAAGEIRNNWNIPVVFVTGNLSDDMLLRASATGAYGYLLKPFRTKELNAAILVALQQHRLARELFSEQTWLRTMLQSLTDGVIATDAEGRVRYMNDAAEALAGCSLERASGKPIEDVVTLTTMSNEPVKLCHLRRALTTKSSIGKSRFIMHSRDGRVIPIEHAASPIQVADEVIGTVTVIVDITERIRREHELEVERERLEEEVQLTSQALGETRSELRALSGHLMTAQEEERRRVARELHDDLNQRAALAEIELERVQLLLPPEDQRVHQVLQQVRQQIADLSEGLREVSHRLHPAAVEHLGLPRALRALIEEYRRNGEELTFVAGSAIPDVPLDVATALYRISQEGLRNALKHAPGAPVKVTLEKRDRELRLSIEDAGPGFDLDCVRGKGGLGLLSMQERARLAGGSLQLRSRPGDGTLIVVRVPLADNSRPF